MKLVIILSLIALFGFESWALKHCTISPVTVLKAIEK